MDTILESILKESIASVMTACPLPVTPDTPVSKVIERFSTSACPIIVVETDGTLAGVITPADFISALTPGALARERHIISGLDRLLKSTAQNARDLMSDEPLTIPEAATIADALHAMEHGHTTSVVLVNAGNRAVGCAEFSEIIAFLHRSMPR